MAPAGRPGAGPKLDGLLLPVANGKFAGGAALGLNPPEGFVATGDDPGFRQGSTSPIAVLLAVLLPPAVGTPLLGLPLVGVPTLELLMPAPRRGVSELCALRILGAAKAKPITTISPKLGAQEQTCQGHCCHPWNGV